MLYTIADEKKKVRDAAAAKSSSAGAASAKAEMEGQKARRVRRHFVHGGGLARLNLQLDTKKDGGGQVELLKQVELYLAGAQVASAQHKTVEDTAAGSHTLMAGFAARNATMREHTDVDVSIRAARYTRVNLMLARMNASIRKQALMGASQPEEGSLAEPSMLDELTGGILEGSVSMYRPLRHLMHARHLADTKFHIGHRDDTHTHEHPDTVTDPLADLKGVSQGEMEDITDMQTGLARPSESTSNAPPPETSSVPGVGIALPLTVDAVGGSEGEIDVPMS
jgi:hypothetical protein